MDKISLNSPPDLGSGWYILLRERHIGRVLKVSRVIYVEFIYKSTDLLELVDY
jgi:hypothetical protein